MGMNLYSKSVDDLTPLHWACLVNSEIAMIYLLAWYPEKAINLQDKDGNTALHLTIKSAGELGSGRPMRQLLLNGADKTIKNDDKKTPVDCARTEIENKKLSRELVGNLTQKTKCSCL